MKKKVLCIVILMILLSSVCYAKTIHFDLSYVDTGEGSPFIDIENNVLVSGGRQFSYPDSIKINRIDQFPRWNIIETGRSFNTASYGYITCINGQYYWAGRCGVRSGLRYTVPPWNIPLGDRIPEVLPVPDEEWKPDMYPFNAADKKIVYESDMFNKIENLRSAPGRIGKWVFGWDDEQKCTKIFVDGVYCVETDIPFRVLGETEIYPYENVLYWEDDNNFYIRNYNLLISTNKSDLYDALTALEKLPIIKVDDTILGFAQPPVMENDRTLVPMRFLFENLGAKVDWDDSTQSATATVGDNTVTFGIDRNAAIVNGEEIEMDVPPRLINDKTLVPIRFLSEHLGYKVEWNEENRLVTVSK